MFNAVARNACASLGRCVQPVQAFGGPVGGYLGDKAAYKFPNHGRIVVCQFSVASGIPFTILVLKVCR